ncbi:L-cystine transporter tcyP [Alkalihalobacillus alcalophilus ATCC 27647 = CGMCC 1.3604]|uniref:L-cystine uptake protein TcyP n=1 Tax=Alkalihalobacillus alcalophilus ATCC 27647 = CGMCC 1.3604 TaxID=1218173 RepID=A0A4S4K3H3_ALKAL|nr:L-cystine transporter tcyP [Alkalihalobacillus alcalophilus ATCC 27647 = CGMCC 1.3604]
MFTILNIIIMLLFIFGLYVMQKKQISFSKRVFTALGVGIVFGLLLQWVYGSSSEIIAETTSWYNIVGTGYIRFLQMIVMPLIFISILAAFTKLTITKNLGKVSGLIIAILVGTTAVAATVGIVTTLGFNLEAIEIEQGEAEIARGAAMEENYTNNVEGLTFPQQVIQLLPANPFLDFTGARSTSTIAVVIFAIFLGIAYLGVRRKEPEQADMFAKIIDSIHAIVMRVVRLIIRLTPYGVLAIMTRTAATSDLASIANLGKFVVASYVALIAMFIIHLMLLLISGLNPITYVKKAFPVLAFAFTSRTSAGALPLNIETQRKLGVPEGTANFAGSFGLSIGQNGCAGIYPAMLAVMIAPTVGINPLDPGFLFTLIVIVAVSSFGVAGVGGGATFAALLVLSALDLPIALAGLLISVEPLIDMGRTAVNVSGSMTAGTLTGKWTKELDETVYNDQTQRLETQDI